MYERRKAPDRLHSTQQNDNADSRNSNKDSSNTGAAPNAEQEGRLGGGVRLEMNGLKAVAAISRQLAADVVSSGLYANKVLLHDTQGELRPELCAIDMNYCPAP